MLADCAHKRPHVKLEAPFFRRLMSLSLQGHLTNNELQTRGHSSISARLSGPRSAYNHMHGRRFLRPRLQRKSTISVAQVYCFFSFNEILIVLGISYYCNKHADRLCSFSACPPYIQVTYLLICVMFDRISSDVSTLFIESTSLIRSRRVLDSLP